MRFTSVIGVERSRALSFDMEPFFGGGSERVGLLGCS